MEALKYKRVAFTEDALRERIRALGEKISRDYAGRELVLVCILKGTMYFFADLTRHIDIPVQLDFMSIGVYPNSSNQSGVVRITKDLDIAVTGKHVLVVEDIIRTGLTTVYLVQNLESRLPESVKVCSLLINPDQQLINVPVAYYGFKVTNTWLAGYGMDIGEKWRNIPYIVEIDRAEIEKG